jgi:hypothetical protein
MQWQSIYNGGVALPKFQYATGLLTINKYASSPTSGEMLNRYGRNSTESITVDNPDSTETVVGITYTHVAVTNYDSNVVAGDSGGPWWTGASGGASAVGIQSSKIWRTFIGGGTCCYRAVFTPALNLYNIWPGSYYYTG